jgi:hypothetical protein
MLKLIIFIIIFTIISLRSVISFNSTDFCYSIKNSKCNKLNYTYHCAKNMCSLNAEKCNKYNRHRRSFVFRSLIPLIEFNKEIKRCDDYLNENTIDLNKYCLNRRDCLESNQLVVYGITIKNEIKKVDCRCQGDFKYQCNENYCTNDLDSCKMVQKLEKNNIKIKDCSNRKMFKVIQNKRRTRF